MQLRIDNEYDRLAAVLVHRPGREIDRLTHDTMRQFLFEDIPYLRRMQDEHDAFVAKMRGHGIHVVYLKHLLKDVLANEAVRAKLLDQVCRCEMVPAVIDDLVSLEHWDLDALVEILFAGLTADEFLAATGQRIATPGAAERFLLPPIPNAYFTRDPAVVVHDAAISCKMHFPQRIRESMLTRAVLENHPEFRDNTITYGGTSEPTEDRPFTIEGGDVIVLSSEAVLIGDSERTRSETIELLAAKCFKFGRIKRVYEIPIPTERSFMHLDTVFTVVDRGVVLWFGQVMQKVGYIHRYEPDGDDGRGDDGRGDDGRGDDGRGGNGHCNNGHGCVRRIPETRALLEVLHDEFESDVTVIDTAGGHQRFASREQRTDGTNCFAIAPRVAITYERNERTNAALEQHGIQCVGIDDSELVRGLGGPRCMTMPLRRTP